MTSRFWPNSYDKPDDVAEIEKISLSERGLPASTYEVLIRAAGTWPDRLALRTMPSAARWNEHTTVTFRGLLHRVNQVANLLDDLGVGRADAVGLLAPNCEELVVATLAAEVAGIAAPVNPGLAAGHVNELLQRSGARVLIAAGPELSEEIWSEALALAHHGGLDAVLALRPTGAGNPRPRLESLSGTTVGYLDELSTAYPTGAFNGRPPGAGDIAAVFHTGGTTGIPKLAAHTHANQVTDAWMVAANTRLDQDAVIFAALPLFHVNALIVTLVAPLLRGQSVVWAGPAGYRDPDLLPEYWKLVEAFGISAMSGVPTIYQALARIPVNADISSMRMALVGASPLPPAVREGFEGATGIPLLEGYGLTEATCASLRCFIDHPRQGSVGVRMPYQDAKIVWIDEDGTWIDLPVGEVGVLAIKGPTVFPGYVLEHGPQGPVLDSLGKLHDGWLDTGDLARIDKDGFVYLAGRAKDIIIRGGHNIDPATIEDVLLEHPDVTGASAVGRPDLHAGEVPVAFVTLSPDATVTEDQLQQWAAARVPEAAAAPKAVIRRDSLPVTAVGKLYKVALRAEVAADVAGRALADVPGIANVEGVVEDGGIAVIVHARRELDELAVKAALGGFALTWRVVHAAEPA